MLCSQENYNEKCYYLQTYVTHHRKLNKVYCSISYLKSSKKNSANNNVFPFEIKTRTCECKSKTFYNSFLIKLSLTKYMHTIKQGKTYLENFYLLL